MNILVNYITRQVFVNPFLPFGGGFMLFQELSFHFNPF